LYGFILIICIYFLTSKPSITRAIFIDGQLTHAVLYKRCGGNTRKVKFSAAFLIEIHRSLSTMSD